MCLSPKGKMRREVGGLGGRQVACLARRLSFAIVALASLLSRASYPNTFQDNLSKVALELISAGRLLLGNW